MADLVESLLGAPGLYVGPQAAPEDASGAPPSVARVEISALPGGSGVMMMYEVLSATDGVGHHEHALLARTPQGLVLVTSHSHADVTTVLTETEPGYFPAADGSRTVPHGDPAGGARGRAPHLLLVLRVGGRADARARCRRRAPRELTSGVRHHASPRRRSILSISAM